MPAGVGVPVCEAVNQINMAPGAYYFGSAAAAITWPSKLATCAFDLL